VKFTGSCIGSRGGVAWDDLVAYLSECHLLLQMWPPAAPGHDPQIQPTINQAAVVAGAAYIGASSLPPSQSHAACEVSCWCETQHCIIIISSSSSSCRR
jgi:hypothetical protein